MKVSQLWTYPIKSIRGTSIQEGVLTKHGFPYDRRFMLCKVKDDSTLQNMHVPAFPAMCLFRADIDMPDPEHVASASVVVTYKPPSSDEPESTLKFPLVPDTAVLSAVDIVMHASGTKAFKMEKSLCDWFSSRFGFEVVLVYLGNNFRDVLCSNPANAQSGNSWLASIAGNIPLLGTTGKPRDRITFADCVPYLVVSQTSVDNLSGRLEGETMDVSKFRPNIVVEGAPEAWEEDFWALVQLGEAKIITAHNCARCASINVDYSTGKMSTGKAGNALKALQKDRRIDKGMKYNPVFGRYSFLDQSSDGKILRVGDEVTVLKRNTERTTFDWESLTA